MHLKPLLRLAATCALTGVLSAQCFYVPDNGPGAGSCNVIPFGTNTATWRDQIYQSVITAADLGNPTAPLGICSLGFAACNDFEKRSKTLQIRMAQLGTAGFTSTFARNLVVPMGGLVVLEATDYSWPAVKDNWVDIGLQRAFPFVPGQGDLVVQIVTTGNDRSAGGGSSGFRTGGRARLYNYRWGGPTPPLTGTLGRTAALKMRVCSGVASTGLYGSGCNGLKHDYSGSSKLGQTLNMNITGGPSTGVAAVILGVSNGTPLVVGPNCTLYVSLDFFFVGATTNGSFSQALAIPNNPGLFCGVLFTQGGALDPMTNQTSVSNWGRIVIGN